MLQVKTADSFNNIIKTVGNKFPYSIEIRGSRKIICANGKSLALFRPNGTNPDIKSKQARNLLKVVRASITRYIKKVNYDVPVVESKCSPTYSNRYLWSTLNINDEFYIIDAMHCYWRIAYLNKYIGKGLYEKYADNKELKIARNISLSILVSNIKREYYNNGNKINTIDCDTSLYRRIYDNIRYSSYNLCGTIKDAIINDCLSYRTDAIFTLPAGVDTVKNIFQENNIFFRVDKCIKLHEKYYSTSDGEIKKFI